jgi:WD domain, G-beta repeat.
LPSVFGQSSAGATDATSGGGGASSTTPAILRDFTNISHDALVEQVRFHPSDPSILCTNVADNTVQFWDFEGKRIVFFFFI